MTLGMGLTPVSVISCSGSYRWVALKKGPYCLTGLPLLLNTVRPVPTQRCGVGPIIDCLASNGSVHFMHKMLEC